MPASSKSLIFVSSVQKELAAERRTLKEYVHNDPLLRQYQRLFSASKPTASRELEQLRSIGVLAKVGTTGKGTHYVLAGKGLIKGSKGSSTSKGSQRAHGKRLPGTPSK
jgi:hypothetical protein